MSLTHTTFRAFSLTMLVFGLAPGVGFADPPVKWKANGASIEFSNFDGSCLSTWLNASKGGPTTAPQTHVYYHVWDECAMQTVAYGEGLIPNTAFKVSTKGATLAFTPKVGATFIATGPLGAITLTVTPNGDYTSTFSGHSEYTYPGHVFRTHGLSTWESASVSGTTMAGTIDSGSASIGTSRDRSMEFERRSK
jgi:hypothetical protein